jgi:hypothetical protein
MNQMDSSQVSEHLLHNQAFQLHVFHTVIQCKEYRMPPNYHQKNVPKLEEKEKKKIIIIDPPEAISAPQNAQFCS